MNWIKMTTATALALGLFGAAFGQSSTAAAEAKPVNVTGEWQGQCDTCIATGFTLVLSQVGTTVTGTFKAEGPPALADGYGVDVKPILDVKLSGEKLQFEAKGKTGRLFYVKLTLNPDGKGFTGRGWYGNAGFNLKLSLVPN